MKKEYDCTNLQAVGMNGDEIVILMPRARMTKAEALIHAGWLVVLADHDDEFQQILEEIKST